MLVPLEEYAEYCPSYAGWGLFPLMPSLSAMAFAERKPSPSASPKKNTCQEDEEKNTTGDVRDMCIIS
ncbi:unnamed protein product [Cutaneotrichosporon oleaginosum]